MCLAALGRDPDRLDALFRETLSPLERSLVGAAEFSDDALGATVRRLLGLHELTQQELAEGIGLAQSRLSRVLNGRERWSVELLETIAQALDVAPEIFVEYRLVLIDEWLRHNAERADVLFFELGGEWAPAESRSSRPVESLVAGGRRTGGVAQVLRRRLLSLVR